MRMVAPSSCSAFVLEGERCRVPPGLTALSRWLVASVGAHGSARVMLRRRCPHAMEWTEEASCEINDWSDLCYRPHMATQTPGARPEDRWRDILSVHARTMGEIDRVLHPYSLGASDFEVLDLLASCAVLKPAEQCRVQEIAGRVHLSQSALSRLIARLAKESLVERTAREEDRRGVWVAITPKGRDLHAEVLPLQRSVLTRTLGA